MSIPKPSYIRMVGNIVRTVNSMRIGPLKDLICCEVSSLIRNNAGCNTMTVDTALCKSTDGSFGRSIAFREDKPISKLNVYFNRGRRLRSMMSRSNVLNTISR